MVDEHLVYAVVLIVILWLGMTWYWGRQQNRRQTCQTPPTPAMPTQQSSRMPTPFPGLTHKPHCGTCEQSEEPASQLPCCPPPRMVSARGRRREVDTSNHFCPHPTCDYAGWVGRGNLRANGHPSGGSWRQLHCVACDGYFLETHGTLFHGKHVSAERIV